MHLPKAPPAKRTDDEGRAFAGSQLHLQIWVNCRPLVLSSLILESLGLAENPKSVRWLSPLRREKYREYRDGTFLRAIGQGQQRAKLRAFWPSRGPVWDGLAVLDATPGATARVFLVEAKSYPEEVHGGGCKATPDSAALKTIRKALDESAEWLGVKRTLSWEGRLYQSANRIAHLYFLRKVLGLDAYLANVCFVGDPRRATLTDAWIEAHHEFRAELGIDKVSTPWMAEIVAEAGTRKELLNAAM